jgi:hypothetical protein
MGKSDLPLTSFQLANFGPTEKARFNRRSLRSGRDDNLS